MIVVYAYIVYIVVSVGLTIWVAKTLHKNGRIFLIDAFHGNEAMADSVNHLLVVGFYLINIGFVSLALRYGDHPQDIAQAFEYLGTKLGMVLLVLGGMHFFNMFNFDKMRRKAKHSEQMERIMATQNTPETATAISAAIAERLQQRHAKE